jgi:hypothetical protein
MEISELTMYGRGKEFEGDSSSLEDYEHEKWSGRLSVWDFKKTLADDDVLAGVFTLNFRGLTIPNCKVFYTRESGVDFRLPCARFDMYKRDRDELVEKLSAAIADCIRERGGRMSIRLKQATDQDLTVFQIDCCNCGKTIENAADWAVVFRADEAGRATGEYWFVHKRFASPKGRDCFEALEAREEGDRMPWWELRWFLKCLPANMLDLDVSGQVAMDSSDYTVKRAKKRKKPIPNLRHGAGSDSRNQAPERPQDSPRKAP